MKLIKIKDLAKKEPNSFIDGDWIEAEYLTDEGIRLIQTGNIELGRLNDKNKKFISENSFSSLKCKEIRAGDILICRLADPIGRCCLITKLAQKSIVAVDISILRIDENIANNKFISYLINSDEFLNRCNLLSGGSTRQRISRRNLGKLQIGLPSIEEQNKISEILISLDRIIEKTEQIIEKYKKIKEGIINDLFTRGIGIEEKLRPIYDEKPELYKKSKLGYIPIEWEVKTLKDLCSEPIRDFGSFSSTKLIDFLEDGIPFIKSEMIKENYIDWDEVSYISEDVHLLLNKSHVKKDTILFSKIGSALGKAVVYAGDRGICNSNAASAKITIDNSKADNYFICYYLNFELTQVRLKNKIVSLLPRINLGDLSSLLAAVPPLLEQEKIKKIIDSQIELIRMETIKLNKYKNIKKGLMNDLISGNVGVKL